MKSRRPNVTAPLAALDDADLDLVSGGNGASYGTCVMDALGWGAGGAVAGSAGGAVGAGLGFVGGAGASAFTDPNCWDGQNSMASAAGHAIDGYFSSNSNSGAPDVNEGSYTAAGDYTGY